MSNSPFIARHGLDANYQKVTSVAEPTHVLTPNSYEGVNHLYWRKHTPALPHRTDIAYSVDEVVLGTSVDPAQTQFRAYVCISSHTNQPLTNVTYWKPLKSYLYHSIVSVSPVTAAVGNLYFVDTSGGAVTVTLPATPSADDVITIVDYANNFKTYNCTIDPGAVDIEDSTADWVLTQNGSQVELTYCDATKGWKVTSTNIVDGGTF